VPVALQRLDGDTFATIATQRTDTRGRFTFTTTVPSGRTSASYRVWFRRRSTPIRTVVTGTTTRVTMDPDPTKEPIDRIGANLDAISGDGRLVAYDSQGVSYLWNRETRSSEPVFGPDAPSVSGECLSYDGRYVAYSSHPSGYVGKNSTGDVILLDRATGATTWITSDNVGSLWPSLSGDGLAIAFESLSTRLSQHDTNDGVDIFLWDGRTGRLHRVTAGNGISWGADISADGRWVTFESTASNLVRHDTNEHSDVFLWDSFTGRTRRIARAHSVTGSSTVSGDGRFVAYAASPYDPDRSSSQTWDVYIWNRLTGRSRRVTAVAGNTRSPQISDDGGHVAYTSHASGLVPGDERHDGKQIFVWDRVTGTTTRIVRDLNSLSPRVSSDGSHVAYDSGDLDMINGPPDVYLWDRT
jgi:Tol biopolymer transport system component